MNGKNNFNQSALITPLEWFTFALQNAWIDNIRQYQRTLLGPFWMVLSQVVYILGIAFVYSSVFGSDPKTMMPYLSSGIIVWTYISTILSTSATVLIANGSVMSSFQIPFSTFSLQNLFRFLIVFFHGIIIHIVVMIMYGDGFSFSSLLFFPGLILCLIVLYPFTYFMGVLGARYRDIGPAIGASVYFLFLVSPIIWEPSVLSPEKRFIADLNPIYHLMSIVRLPLIMRAPEVHQYIIVIALGVLLWALAFWCSRTLGKKVIFWV